MHMRPDATPIKSLRELPSVKSENQQESFNIEDLTDQPNMNEKFPLEFPKNFVHEANKQKSDSLGVTLERALEIEEEGTIEDQNVKELKKT